MTIGLTIDVTSGQTAICDAVQDEFYDWIYASVMRGGAGLGEDHAGWHSPGRGKLVSSKTNHTTEPELAKPALRQPKVRMD